MGVDLELVGPSESENFVRGKHCARVQLMLEFHVKNMAVAEVIYEKAIAAPKFNYDAEVGRLIALKKKALQEADGILVEDLKRITGKDNETTKG